MKGLTLCPVKSSKANEVAVGNLLLYPSLQEVDEIAHVINTEPDALKRWMSRPSWDDSLEYWRELSLKKDLKLAEKVWVKMIDNDEHINPVEYAEKSFDAPPGDPDVYALIESHLFCADNLTDSQMLERIAETIEYDGEPIRYEGQPLENAYHFWVYPNWTDGIFSTTFARANIFGDLVVSELDHTCLVCIKHGRLSLTRQVSNDVVSVNDPRLLCVSNLYRGR